MAPAQAHAQSAHRVLVWDAVARVLHWSLAALVVFNLVRDDGDLLHRIVGYAAVGVVAARWLWGAIAQGHARFSGLRPSPRATSRYVRELLRGRAPRHVGHDPLGLWMAWLLWSLVLLMGLTGWMSHLDAFWGDERVHDVHAWLANALMVCVAVHLAGVAFMSWHWRENLPKSMVTGHKRMPDQPRTGRTD